MAATASTAAATAAAAVVKTTPNPTGELPFDPKRRFANKVAIVTASSTGIGLAIAQRLALEGASVVVSSRKLENVQRAVADIRQLAGLPATDAFDAKPKTAAAATATPPPPAQQQQRVIGLVCHVGRADDRKRLVETTVREFGQIDVLINNAAINPIFGPVTETSEEAWDKIMEVNVKAPFLLARDVAQHMATRATGGAIVIIASIAAYSPMPGLGAYSVSKTALTGLTRVLAAEWASSGIRVNAVLPGVIKTAFSEALWKGDGGGDAAPATDASAASVPQMLMARVPMQRFGVPHEVAGLVAYLASTDASYVTGENVVVSGGLARL